jgi:hypothetical protein
MDSGRLTVHFRMRFGVLGARLGVEEMTSGRDGQPGKRTFRNLMAALIRWRRGCSLGRAYRRSTVVANCTSPSDLLGARNRSSSWSAPSGGAGTKTRWVTRTIP